MPAAGEFRFKPGPHDIAGDPRADDALTHDQDVGVIVFAAHLGRKMVVAERGAHFGEPVGHDRHADARSADQDAAVHRAVGHCLGDLGPVVRIVNGILACRPEVRNLDVLKRLDILEDFFLQDKAAVVAADRQFHVKSRLS